MNKRQYFETVHTKAHDVVLVKTHHSSVSEVYCNAFSGLNKKIRMPAFDGYYFVRELTLVDAITLQPSSGINKFNS